MALAPMYDVTDAAFRLMVTRHGKPDVMFTEFVSCDGMSSAGRPNLIHHLKYDPSERPIVAQVFGDKPQKHYETAQLVKELGFDGIDLNMGCPVKTVCKTGAGAALINNPELAIELIEETRRGAGSLPVSVKTRIGYDTIGTEEWIGHLLKASPAAIIVHLRTRKEMSDVKAHWEEIEKAVALADGTGTLILGNGDVANLAEAEKLARETGVDGIMLGRAIFGNPWLFNREIELDSITPEDKLEAMLEHADLYEDIFRGQRQFAVMRKHLFAYASGFHGSKELRKMLENVSNSSEVREAIEQFRPMLTRTQGKVIS